MTDQELQEGQYNKILCGCSHCGKILVDQNAEVNSQVRIDYSIDEFGIPLCEICSVGFYGHSD